MLDKYFCIFYTNEVKYGGIAQLARAPALQAGGHRFESDYLHHNIRQLIKSLKQKLLGYSSVG